MTTNRFIEDIRKNFISIVGTSDDLAETAGRPPGALGVGEHIWADIKKKLNLKEKGYLLDIGCGFGEVTKCLLQDPVCNNISLTLLDAPEILERIENTFSGLIKENTTFIPGYFPGNKNLLTPGEKFDYIISYSVLHYTDNPKAFIENAVQLLAPGGRLLLGDFANVNKKGRFLSTSYGRAFEAEYRNVNINEIPVYKDQYSFVKSAPNHNKNINDGLLLYVMKIYRKLGFDVFVLPQPIELSCSKTREDILIIGPS